MRNVISLFVVFFFTSSSLTRTIIIIRDWWPIYSSLSHFYFMRLSSSCLFSVLSCCGGGSMRPKLPAFSSPRRAQCQASRHQFIFIYIIATQFLGICWPSIMRYCVGYFFFLLYMKTRIFIRVNEKISSFLNGIFSEENMVKFQLHYESLRDFK